MADIQHIIGCPSCGGSNQYRGMNIHEETQFQEVIPPEEPMQGGDVQEQPVGKNFYDRYGLNSSKGYGGYGNTIIWIILIIIVLIIIGALFMRNKSTPRRR